MYGSWFGVTMGAAGVLLFIVAAALTAWTPLFALAIFAAIGTVLLVLAAMRRSAEDAPGTGTQIRSATRPRRRVRVARRVNHLGARRPRSPPSPSRRESGESGGHSSPRLWQ